MGFLLIGGAFGVFWGLIFCLIGWLCTRSESQAVKVIGWIVLGIGVLITLTMIGFTGNVWDTLMNM